MKPSTRALPLAMLLLQASAQTTTVVNNASDTGVVTSYFSTCPTATTTTITVDTTTTICPGKGCAGTTTVFYDIRPITTVGPDGRTTVKEVFPYTAPCPCDGGICDAIYTVTRECPCTAPHPATVVPPGFTTAVVACDMCAQNGGPSTVTIVTPCSTGPYASQTPVMGTPYNGAYASAGASAYVSVGPNGAVASAGADAVASVAAGYASANAEAHASAWVSNSSAGANANASGGSMPASNTTGIVPLITPYHGSADRAACAVSAVLAGVIGVVAFLL